VILGGGKSAAAPDVAAHQGDLPLAALAGVVGDTGVMNKGCELIEFTGAAEDVDMGKLFEKINAVALGHAADDSDDQARVGSLRGRSSPRRDQTFCSACSRTEQVL